ncbi:translocation and assembly module lipoprotein TamL [Arenibacter certesii]|uniref:translocation and assembly module lipoprotein TamL n=1 Tax=Arenibacter certesii TaxID=228955 RepID=UPI0004079767|nr:BamA/TamA family outer membrane protein [Arenibacter certesii]
MNTKIKIRCLYALIFLWALQSCSVKKYIPQDELLYTDGNIQLEADTTIRDLGKINQELQNLLKPEPNTKFLGAYIRLWAHYKSQKEKPGFINRFLNKKIGEEPVYLSDIDLEKTEELINNRLENRGFFRNNITSSVYKKTKTASIVYQVGVKKPYTLASYQLEGDSLPILADIIENLGKTTLAPGIRYDLQRFKMERERIDQDLKAKGYYNFNADFLIFEADTNQYKNKRFDLFLRLKKDVPKKSLVPYRINDIKVFPNYSVATDSLKMDTVQIAGVDYIQHNDFFKPKRLAPYILLNEGETYDPLKSKLTSNRLASIGTYKYINIQYKEDNTDMETDGFSKLDAFIYLSPLNKRSLRAELQAVTKSNNFAGPTLSLTYSNRNFFKGGETLNVTGNVGYETQLDGNNSTGLSSTQLGFKTDLIFPRLLSLFNISERFKYAVPKTKISLGMEHLNRSKLYSLTSFSSIFGYGWNENKYVYHELNPISINYVNLSKTTAEFETILDNNPFLRSSFEQQFIAGLTYSFTYNEVAVSRKRNTLFFNGNIDLAGNTLNLFGKRANPGEDKTILGLAYAQYAKTDIDLRYHLSVGSSQKLIGRIFGGIGIPYGNSNTLPFSKQFFSGGPYSVRAFRIRSLGPGTYNPESDDSGAFFDQSGDIRLEANLEYRFPIYSFLKGAVFADAGNVWLINENDALPGGKFTSNFMDELGIGVGAGLRIDIQSFVLRFDLATPLQKPYLPKGKRFEWDISQPILNFAIGYPF